MRDHYSFARAPPTGRRKGHPRPRNRQHSAVLALEESGLQTPYAGLHHLRRPHTPEKVGIRFPPLRHFNTVRAVSPLAALAGWRRFCAVGARRLAPRSRRTRTGFLSNGRRFSGPGDLSDYAASRDACVFNDLSGRLALRVGESDAHHRAPVTEPILPPGQHPAPRPSEALPTTLLDQAAPRATPPASPPNSGPAGSCCRALPWSR